MSETAGEAVLVTEDHEGVRFLIDRILSGAGYRVVLADSGSAALDRLSSEPIDLLVTDVVMPGMMGLELVERATAVQPDLKVLLISGDISDKHVAESGLSKTALLEKPFTADGLLERVRAALATG